MRGNKTRGFICSECDVLNIDTEVCLSCGQLRDYHFVKPNLYIYKGSKGQNPKFRLLYKTRE